MSTASTIGVHPKLNEGVSAAAETEKKNPLSPSEQKLQTLFEKSHQFNVRFIKGVRIFAIVAAPLSFLGTLAVASPLAKVALVISVIVFAIIIWACPIMIRKENRAFTFESTLHKINLVENLYTDIKVMVSKKLIGADDDKKQLTLDDFPSVHKSAEALNDDIAHAIMEKIQSITIISLELASATPNKELERVLVQLTGFNNQVLDHIKHDGIAFAKGYLCQLKYSLQLVEERMLEMKKDCKKAYFDFLNKKR